MKILILLVWAVVNTSSVFMRESPSYTSNSTGMPHFICSEESRGSCTPFIK
jgi:hypothetical protein